MHEIIRIVGTIRVLFEGRVLLEEIQYLCEKYNIKHFMMKNQKLYGGFKSGELKIY